MAKPFLIEKLSRLYAIAVYYFNFYLGGTMIYLIGALLIPVIAVVLLLISAGEDFWQIVTLKMSLSRLFSDLIHILLIVVVSFLAEIFCLFELFRQIL
jgi:hypothetical protein